MRRWRGWAKLSLLGLLACRETTRPAPIADPVSSPSDPDSRDEPGSLIDPSELPDPDRVSSCGAATVTLDFVRPNLYFAIDASGSMTLAIPRGEAPEAPGITPRNRYVALSRSIEAMLTRIGHRVNYGATLFPSADVTCDPGEEVHPLGPGDDVSFAVSGEVGPVLREFIFRVNRRTPRGGTPVALALRGLVPMLDGAGPETYVFLVTDGGPNCNAEAHCNVDTCIPNIEEFQTSDGIRCTDAVNCCDPTVFGPDNCLDTNGSLEAVQILAAAGVKTFVIGIPGSDAYATLLDQLALAGGVGKTESPHYYRVADADALTQTVSSLGITVALGCSIELTSPPPDPALVNLFFDGELVPSDSVDGWTFSDDHTVEVRGAACELLQTGEVLQAEVVAGCPIVLR
jgi:hypothetical protein